VSPAGWWSVNDALSSVHPVWDHAHTAISAVLGRAVLHYTRVHRTIHGLARAVCMLSDLLSVTDIYATTPPSVAIRRRENNVCPHSSAAKTVSK